jgi:glycosyltransferase involved in cell wall biosynthesis
LVKNGENGFLTKHNNPQELAASVFKIIGEEDVYQKLSECACNSVSVYSRNRVLEEMKTVYGRM